MSDSFLLEKKCHLTYPLSNNISFSYSPTLARWKPRRLNGSGGNRSRAAVIPPIVSETALPSRQGQAAAL